MEKITVQDLMEAGVHFGHQTKRWNPKMKPYVYGVRHGVTIFDLTKTIRKLAEACEYLRDVAANNGAILFVGTKRQARELMRTAAEETGMYHMCHRWLGGTLTNNRVIMSRVKRLNELRRMEEEGEINEMPNKEAAQARRELSKLERSLGGIADLRKLPDVLFIADIERDGIAVKEARALGIPVVAIVDSNCDPVDVDYVVPANDDAVRSLKVLINAMVAAILEGRHQAGKSGGEGEEEAEGMADRVRAAKAAASSELGDGAAGAAADTAAAGEPEPAVQEGAAGAGETAGSAVSPEVAEQAGAAAGAETAPEEESGTEEEEAPAPVEADVEAEGAAEEPEQEETAEGTAQEAEEEKAE